MQVSIGSIVIDVIVKAFYLEEDTVFKHLMENGHFISAHITHPHDRFKVSQRTNTTT